ncbi:MAG: dTDP-4-dehydrorhamnose reductase [Thermodesulfovibrio sp.]|nr:dTDP-4-dehydrorhamnose reductase [Thermodesulfovibrio sp.]
MRYLVIGSKGQLGKAFCEHLEKRQENYLAFGREELDVTDFDKVRKILKEIRPDIVLNCSAYNLVDKAEVEFEKALAVNSFGPRNLALVCRELGAFLVHYSTDYVFDGKKEVLYTEEDSPNPLNKYGYSKWLGEKEIISVMENKFLVLRTSWVYGKGTQNFLYKLTKWAEESEYLKIACDEFSVPTSTKTIVEVTLKAIQSGLIGLYHLVNTDYASRYEWAKKFFKLRGVRIFIYPSYSADFKLLAPRPRWSSMSNLKICKELGIEIKDWQSELKKFILES